MIRFFSRKERTPTITRFDSVSDVRRALMQAINEQYALAHNKREASWQLGDVGDIEAQVASMAQDAVDREWRVIHAAQQVDPTLGQRKRGWFNRRVVAADLYAQACHRALSRMIDAINRNNGTQDGHGVGTLQAIRQVLERQDWQRNFRTIWSLKATGKCKSVTTNSPSR